MKKNLFLLLFFFLQMPFSGYAQPVEIQKLKNELSSSKNDTNKLTILFNLIESISDDTEWLPYNAQLGKLANDLMKENNLKIQQTATKYYGAYFNNLGYAAQNEGNIPVALDCYYKSLKLNEEVGDKAGISMVLNNIGFLKSKQGDYESALDLFKSSYALQQEISDSSGIALSLINIGSIYDNNGNLDSGLFCYEKSLAISELLHDEHKMAMALSNIGGIYDKLNNLDTALYFYKRSLTIQEAINDKEGIAVSQINFGNIYMRYKNYRLAQYYFEHSMRIAKEIGYIEMMRGAALWLSKIYAIQNNYKAAYEMQVLFKQLADSIRNTETHKQAIKKQMQYDYEKKDALVKAENNKNAAIAKKEIEKQRQIKIIVLIASLLLLALLAFGFYNFYNRRKESFIKTVEQVNNKALRSQMNPHFLFNSLNSIQCFISANDAKNASTYIVKFAKLVRMILENSRKQEVLLSEDLKALELYMQLESLRLQHGFDYEIKIDEQLDSDNTLIPPLIIQPFVENAIWHGLQHKKQRGKINIAIRKVEEVLECRIEDNGVGRMAANLAKEPQLEKRKSLGMEITAERIKLYNNIKNTKAFFELTDLIEANEIVTGTLVLLKLPFEEAN